LFLAVELGNAEQVMKLHEICIKKGIIFDMFLFCDTAFRIAPPLIITDEEIENISNLLLQAIDEVVSN